MILGLWGILSGASAQQYVMTVTSPEKGTGNTIAIEDVDLGRVTNDSLGLRLTFTLMGPSVRRQRVVTLTPRLIAGNDSVDFPSVVLHGKWAYLADSRSGALHDDNDMLFRARDAYSTLPYAKAIAYEAWMDNAQLKMVATEGNDCGSVFYTNSRFMYARASAGDPFVQEAAPSTDSYVTDTMAVTVQGGVRHFQGTAYIDFPLNSTEILPDYHDNASELAKIQSTIDSIARSSGNLLQRIMLKGYASPEGSYAANEALARGRVHSLREYLTRNIVPDTIPVSVDYEPEDWAGLRRYIEQSQLPERDAVLKLMDVNLHPDEKLARIAKAYPALYKHLLDEVFPRLRHTDYILDYFATDSDRVVSYVFQRPNGPTAAAATPAETVADGAFASGTSYSPFTDFTATGARFRSYRPLLALKTNLLFDAILAPNIEIEVPLGRRRRWSVMAEVWCPWWRFKHNADGDNSKYYRSDQRPTKHAYQLLTIGAEARYWFLPRCNASRPVLTGAFVGLYAAGGKYDLGYDGVGDQGEFTSIGLSAGYAMPLNRHLNLEFSAAIGYVGGPKVHYENEFDDTHLIYRSDNTFRYVGPTKLKVSLVWIIGK